MYLFINRRLRTPWFLSLWFASAIPAAPLTTTPDDLFLGFRSTADPGLAVDYLIKLGPAATFRDAADSFTVTGLGNWDLDLINYFGGDWHSRAEVFWSVSGATGLSSVGTDPGRTLYVTTPRAVPGLRTVPRLRGTAAAQALPSNKIGNLGAGYTRSNNLARQSSSNSLVGTLQVLTDVNSYGSLVNEVSSYAYFTPIIEGNFANGATAVALDLYRITPATGASIGSPAELLGTFTISTGGVLAFIKYRPSPPLARSLTHYGSYVSVSFGGDPGTSYRIQRSQSLQDWFTLATVPAALDGAINFTDPNPPAGKAFYRLVFP